MRKSIFILLIMFFFLTPVFSQKEKEESLKEQALDDVEALSSRNYPYIEKFHEALREKISGNYREAKKLFNECLKEKQDDDAVYFGLAEIAKAENDVSAALKYFKKAYQLDKENITYLKELAFIHFERANFGEAEVLFKDLCEREPRNADFRYGYSKVLIYNKAYDLAIDELNTLQEQVGNVPELMIMKADLYSELKEYEQSEKTLLLVFEEFPSNKEVLNKVVDFYEQQDKKEKAIRLIEKIVEENPKNGIAQFILAKHLLDKKEYGEFIAIAPDILKNHQVNLEQKLLIFKSIRVIKNEDKTFVLESAKTLYNAHSKDFEVASAYVNALMMNSKTKKALHIARQAAEDNPDNFDAWKFSLSVASTFLDYPILLEDAQKALELFPNFPVIYFAAAEGALYTNHPDEALQYLAGGEIYILENEKKEALFSMRKGEIYFYQKQYKKGIVTFEKALATNTENTNIKLTYALCLSKANIATDVAKEILDAIEDKNKNRDYYLAQAHLAANNNEFEKGIKILEKGINQTQNNAELIDFLGDLHFKNQSLEKAKEAWQLALSSESRNKNLSKKINEEKLYAPQYY